MMDLFTWLEGSSLSMWVREAPTIWAFRRSSRCTRSGWECSSAPARCSICVCSASAGAMPLGPLQSLYRMMWSGFWLNLVTGSLLFAADATSRRHAVAVLRQDAVRGHRRGDDDAHTAAGLRWKRRTHRRSSAPAKRLALLSLAAWVLAITSGRLLAYVQLGSRYVPCCPQDLPHLHLLINHVPDRRHRRCSGPVHPVDARRNEHLKHVSARGVCT